MLTPELNDFAIAKSAAKIGDKGAMLTESIR